MTDTTNTSTVPATVHESWTQELWDKIHSWEQDAIAALSQAGHIIEADVWPFAKAGLSVLLSVAGKAALQAEMSAIPLELSGNEIAAAAAVGAAITGAVAANAQAVLDTEGKQAADAVEADPNATDAEKAVALEGEKLIPGQSGS